MKGSITIAQIQSEFGNPEKNFEKVRKIISQIQPAEHHLLILPELWSSGFDLKQTHIHYQADSRIVNDLSVLASEKKLWIAGSYITKDNDIFHNTFVLNSPSGELFTYHKIHLIRLMNEHSYFQPGNEFVAVNTPFASFGLSLCYDLRFPYQFQQLSHIGCNVFLLPAAWPITRINHWNSLIHARAIENQAFFIACNAVGGTHRETFGGSSAVLSPWGDWLFQGNDQDEYLETIEIDIQETTNLRNQFPVISEQYQDEQAKLPVNLLNYSDSTSSTP
jgi:predicted amidohydrolase